MKNILLIFALIPSALVAQKDMHFLIIADLDYNLLSSTKNDSMEWVVFVDDLYDPLDSVVFSTVSEGETTLDYLTNELGVHHLLLRNKVSGDNVAYVVLRIDYDTRSLRLRKGGRFTILIDKSNDPYAVYAPSNNNEFANPLFAPGILD